VRNDVVEAADELARQLNRFSDETINLRVEADREIAEGVSTVNDALARIEELNAEISKAHALDRPAGDLQDERDRQLTTLSEWMDITVFNRENGEIAVMGRTSSGSATTLVDSKAIAFEFAGANDLDSHTAGDVPNVVGTSSAELTTATGGRLGALLELRDSTLVDFHGDIDQLTASVRDRVNAAHNQGTVGNAGVPEIAGSIATDPTAAITISSANPPNPPELIVNQTDANGEVVDTATIDLSTFPGTFSNDTAGLVGFLNAYNAGELGGMDITVSESGGQLTFTQGNTNEGLTIDTNNVLVDGPQTLGSETRNFSHYYGLNNLLETPNLPLDVSDPPTDITGAAGDITVRSDIKADPDLLSRGTATTAPVPPPVPPAAFPAAVAVGDNTVAQEMAAAFTETGTIPAAGKLPEIDQATLSDYAGDLLAYYATATQRTETARDFQRTMHDELQFRADNKSGVNVDEELSNMVVFEQAYNASARVISTVQQMFDTLDRMMN
jgi:flagellar hook-associated protein 1 FlgK